MALYFLFAASGYAQATITVTPSTTYQVWKGFSFGEGVQLLTYFNPSTCAVKVSISSATRNQIWDSKIKDLGVTGNRLDMYHLWGIEASANDNIDPANTVQSSFDTTLNSSYIHPAGGHCSGDALTDEMVGIQAWRSRVSSDGETPDTEFSWFFYGSGGNAFPQWWIDGGPSGPNGSTGCGVDEAAEASYAVIAWIHNNYSFIPEHLTWNEPNQNGTGPWFAAEDTAYTGVNCTSKPASWYGGWINSTVSRLSAAGFSATKIAATTDFGCSLTVGRLQTNGAGSINSVAGALANVKRVAFHSYTTPGCSTTDLAGIWTEAQSIGADTYSDESDTPQSNACCGSAPDYSFANARQFLSGTSGIESTNIQFWNALTFANVSSWMLYNSSSAGVCASTCLNTGDMGFNNGTDTISATSADGIVLTSDGSTLVTTPFFWGLRQFGKYVRNGYTRVSASSSGAQAANVIATAWKRPDGTLVVVIVNNSASSQLVTVTGLNNRHHTYHELDQSLCTTTGASRCTPNDSNGGTPSGGALAVSIPGDAIWTIAEDPNGVDAYGGDVNQPCSNSAAKWALEKHNVAWWLCTPVTTSNPANPSSHRLFFEGVGCWSYPGNNTNNCPLSLGTKYANASTAAAETQTEFISWNWNAVGQKTFGCFDIATSCAGVNPLPEIQSLELLGRTMYPNSDAGTCSYNPAKSLAWGQHIYGQGWFIKAAADIFDPNVATYFNCYFTNSLGSYKTSNYLVALMIDDSDFFLGVGASPDFDAGGSAYGGSKNDTDLGRYVLTTSPVQTFNPNPTRGQVGGVTPTLYSADSKVYAKQAMASPPANCNYSTPCSLRTYLAKEYGTISVLNTAWSTNAQGFHQSCSNVSSGIDLSSLACTLPIAHNNDTVIVAFGLARAGGLDITGNCQVSDTQGSAWTLIRQTSNLNHAIACAFKGTVAAAGNDVITGSISDSETLEWNLTAVDLSGITATLDGSSVSTGTGSSIATTAITTTQANDYVFAFFYNSNGEHDSVTASNGFASRGATENDNGKETLIADHYPVGAGSQTTTFSGITSSSSGLFTILFALENGTPVGGYTTFDSSGTSRGPVTICGSTTWTGSNSTCTDTTSITNLKMSPLSVLVTVDGVVQAGDCPWFEGDGNAGTSENDCGVLSVGTGFLMGLSSSIIANTSTINYVTGAITVNFKSPLSAGPHTITVIYIQNGWPTSFTGATGLMDEDGSNVWVDSNPNAPNVVCLLPVAGGGPGTDSYACRPGNPGSWHQPQANATMAADLENWIGQFSAEFHTTLQNSWHTNGNPVSLFMGEDQIGGWAAPPNKNILKGASGNLDVLFTQLGWNPDEATNWFPFRSQSDYTTAYDYLTQYYGDHAILNDMFTNANGDSALAAFSADSPFSFNSQGNRGQGYYNIISQMLSALSFNGSMQWIGVSWWGSHDFGSCFSAEHTDWGLKTCNDNAYDGREPASTTISCSSPLSSFNCGNEPAPGGTATLPLGNAITNISLANLLWKSQLSAVPAPATSMMVLTTHANELHQIKENHRETAHLGHFGIRGSFGFLAHAMASAFRPGGNAALQ